jgi:hypothetical protein
MDIFYFFQLIASIIMFYLSWIWPVQPKDMHYVCGYVQTPQLEMAEPENSKYAEKEKGMFSYGFCIPSALKGGKIQGGRR